MTRRWLQSADVEIDDRSGALLVKIGDVDLSVDMVQTDVQGIVDGIAGTPNGKTLKELAAILATPTSLTGGTKTVTAAGTPEALVAASTPCKSVWIAPLCNADGVGTNTKAVFLGDSSNQNMPLLPNSVSGVVLSIDDAQKVYVKVGINGEGVVYRIFA